MIQALAFYLFAGILLVSGVLVISARNPVYSVLFLILGFFNAAGLFVLLGAEFVAFILVIVYVGAVAVLFLFVVMMLDIDFSHLRKGALQYVPLGGLLGTVLLAELFLLFGAWQKDDIPGEVLTSPVPEGVANTEALGAILYTEYVYPFQVAGLILLVAMIGAIVLTHRVRPDVRRQKVGEQIAVRREDVVEIRKVTPGTGV
ncbi:MAG: NADH-quinone oxidoreductase subunit J [Alphaproteobacteria bacterium]|nr:NADH-quinone oxidoreductase subunit J [Alphaproteobacteria bacterium]